MSEQIIDYDGYKRFSWWQNKKRGLNNRYHKYKRHLDWQVHIRRHDITLDFAKIPSTATPILINNFNRLALVQQQIEWLLGLDDEVAIIIVDNLSSYPPLLDFYANLDYPNVQVVDLQFNSWRLGAAYLAKKMSKFPNIIITDSDLIPYPDMPKDIISHLSKL